VFFLGKAALSSGNPERKKSLKIGFFFIFGMIMMNPPNRHGDTVDGRNPAPPGGMFPLNEGRGVAIAATHHRYWCLKSEGFQVMYVCFFWTHFIAKPEFFWGNNFFLPFLE